MEIHGALALIQGGSVRKEPHSQTSLGMGKGGGKASWGPGKALDCTPPLNAPLCLSPRIMQDPLWRLNLLAPSGIFSFSLLWFWLAPVLAWPFSTRWLWFIFCVNFTEPGLPRLTAKCYSGCFCRMFCVSCCSLEWKCFPQGLIQ